MYKNTSLFLFLSTPIISSNYDQGDFILDTLIQQYNLTLIIKKQLKFPSKNNSLTKSKTFEWYEK